MNAGSTDRASSARGFRFYIELSLSYIVGDIGCQEGSAVRANRLIVMYAGRGFSPRFIGYILGGFMVRVKLHLVRIHREYIANYIFVSQLDTDDKRVADYAIFN